MKKMGKRTPARKGFFSNYIFKLTLTLFLITAIAAFLLSLVYGVTKDKIAEMTLLETKTAMENVVPGDNVVFEDVENKGTEVTSISSATSGGKLLGYCVKVSPSGFGGAISLIVGINTENVVTGVQIISHSETVGLGAKADSDSFMDQYKGLKSGISVVKGAVSKGDNSISAITGATITSKAVTAGVNAALKAVAAFS